MAPPMPSSRAPGPPVVALATLALAVLLYPGALLQGEAFFERDLHVDWYPRLAALGRALGEGAWPLWEPGLGFGQPLAADPSVQVFYPVTWLALALPWGTAYTGFVLVHLVVAGLGVARLAERLGAGRAGSWTAALAFVLSGPVQSALNLWHHFAGTAWMPWVLLAADSSARRPSLAAALALATALALQILAGSADLCAMTLVLALALVAARFVRLRRRRASVWPALGSGALALALAAALSCALWWPAAELVLRSSRRALPADVRTAWSVPPSGLARLVAPLDPVRVPFEPLRWTRLYDRPAHPLFFSLYLGLPMLGLSSLALAGRPRRARALGLAGVAVFAAAFGMGPHGPLYGPLAELVPVLRVLRYPSKALLVVALATALLAGLGVRALARVTPRARLAVAAVVLLGSTGVALLASRLPAEIGWSALLGVLFAVVLALQGVHVKAGLAVVLLVSIAGADLVAAHRDLNATLPASLLREPPPVVDALRAEDGRRVHVWDYHTLPGTAQRLLGRPYPYTPVVGAAGIDPRVLAFAAQRQVLVSSTATLFGLETSYDLDNRGLYPRDLNDLCYFLPHVEGTPVHTRLLQLGAVAKVVTLHESGLEGLRLERTLPSLTGERIRIFAVPDPQPRAFLVGRTRVADGEAAFSALLDPAFDPSVEALLASGPRLADAARPEGAVRWLERRADRQRLETTSARPALLVLADAYDPGWRASVDGAGASLLRANVAFRGILVPEGRHVVELVYRPRAVWLGLGVSLSALVTAAALFVAGRRFARARRQALPGRSSQPAASRARADTASAAPRPGGA